MPLDKDEGVVKQHFFVAKLFSTAGISEWAGDQVSGGIRGQRIGRDNDIAEVAEYRAIFGAAGGDFRQWWRSR